MARGKYLKLEEERKLARLDQFAKEHPSDRFPPIMVSLTSIYKENPGVLHT